MYGKATLDIPASGNIGPQHIPCLSDRLAMAIGRAAAWTLSDGDGYVEVSLESGERKLIGLDDVHNQLIFGRLTLER